MEDRIEKKVGLCADCRHAKIIHSGKRTTFYLCRLSETDPTYPKYPSLPVLSCNDHAPLAK